MRLYAWVLAASALLPVHVVAQDKLGRLFFTPAERASLDNQRKLAADEANRPVRRDPQLPKAPPPRMLTLNGVVRRSDGEATIWVNNQPVSDRFQDVDVMPGSITREAVGVQLPGGGRRIKLKVGQSVDSSTGEVEENYRRRPDATESEAADEPTSAKTASASGNEAGKKPRKSRPRGDDAMPPAPAPVQEPARSGSEVDATMPDYR